MPSFNDPTRFASPRPNRSPRRPRWGPIPSWAGQSENSTRRRRGVSLALCENPVDDGPLPTASRPVGAGLKPDPSPLSYFLIGWTLFSARCPATYSMVLVSAAALSAWATMA